MMRYLGIILILALAPIKAFGDNYIESAPPLYQWLTNHQVMNPSSLEFNVNTVINHRFVNVNRIANATPLIKYYADVLSAEGVPVDFAVLPLIESGNNPQARSPKNALGLWQFIPSTGSEWGLQQTAMLDERVDVQKSTVSAAKYLKALYTKFHNWNLVLAAYNWGSGSVEKALKKGLVTPEGNINFKYLPLETQIYLLEFHRFNQLIKAESLRAPLNKYPNQAYLTKIRIKDLNQYLLINPDLKELNHWVLKHMNGFEASTELGANKEILVPTRLFSRYFSLKKISFNNRVKSNIHNECSNQQYRTVTGDSVESVSKKFNLKIDRFFDLNPNVRYIRPGMDMKLC
jgi:membrane-bound lytic murein transglycosylase D